MWRRSPDVTLRHLPPAPNPTPSPLWGHNVTLTIDVTLWLSCGRYVTTLDTAPYQLVEYVVGTLRCTLTSSLTWALGVNLSKFWPSDTAYRYGLINSSPRVLSYHYKQRLGVDVSMHPCPLGLPAGTGGAVLQSSHSLGRSPRSSRSCRNRMARDERGWYSKGLLGSKKHWGFTRHTRWNVSPKVLGG